MFGFSFYYAGLRKLSCHMSSFPDSSCLAAPLRAELGTEAGVRERAVLTPTDSGPPVSGQSPLGQGLALLWSQIWDLGILASRDELRFQSGQ